MTSSQQPEGGESLTFNVLDNDTKNNGRQFSSHQYDGNPLPLNTAFDLPFGGSATLIFLGGLTYTPPIWGVFFSEGQIDTFTYTIARRRRDHRSCSRYRHRDRYHYRR